MFWSKPVPLRMVRKQCLEMTDLGTVTFRRSARARYVSIRVRPFAGVQVTVPAGVSLARAKAFVHEKRAWVAQQLKKTREIERAQVIREDQEIRTRHHRLEVVRCRESALSVRLSKGIIRVRVPDHLKMADAAVQHAIRTGLIAAWRQEAKAYLPQRLAELAHEHGFTYNRVFIKNHRSRWGSCSARNNINLSLHLMRLPDELIDYVLLHELVHTRVKNHGRDFWRLLKRVCPNAQEKDRRLNQFRRPW